MGEPLYEVFHFYESGRIFRTPFRSDEYEQMVEFVGGLRLCGTEYQVFKGDDLYSIETGKTWNPLAQLSACAKGVVSP